MGYVCYTLSMEEPKRPLIFLILAWFAIGFIVYLISNKSPNDSFSIFHIPVGATIAFFFTLFVGSYFLLSFILNNTKRAFIYSLGVTLLLILRVYKLTTPVYLILLLLLLLCLEFLFTNRTKEKKETKRKRRS